MKKTLSTIEQKEMEKNSREFILKFLEDQIEVYLRKQIDYYEIDEI